MDLDRLDHGGILFSPVRKSLRTERSSACLKKVLTVLHDLRPYFQKSKGFQDLNSVEKQVVATLNYLADEGRSGNRKSRKLSGVFCFYSRKYFLCVYLTKQHFVNKKLYRTILFIEN